MTMLAGGDANAAPAPAANYDKPAVTEVKTIRLSSYSFANDFIISLSRRTDADRRRWDTTRRPISIHQSNPMSSGSGVGVGHCGGLLSVPEGGGILHGRKKFLSGEDLFTSAMAAAWSVGEVRRASAVVFSHSHYDDWPSEDGGRDGVVDEAICGGGVRRRHSLRRKSGCRRNSQQTTRNYHLSPSKLPTISVITSESRAESIESMCSTESSGRCVCHVSTVVHLKHLRSGECRRIGEHQRGANGDGDVGRFGPHQRI